MTTLIVAMFAIAMLILLGALRGKKQSPPSEFPYQLAKGLLSNAERSFYGVLVQAVGASTLVFAKVRVADVLRPGERLSRSNWQRAFNAVSAKHFDFLLCDPAGCAVKLAVELDDSSHASDRGKKRDRLVNEACKSAGLPLLRVKAARGYVVADIQSEVARAIAVASGGEAAANRVRTMTR